MRSLKLVACLVFLFAVHFSIAQQFRLSIPNDAPVSLNNTKFNEEAGLPQAIFSPTVDSQALKYSWGFSMATQNYELCFTSVIDADGYTYFSSNYDESQLALYKVDPKGKLIWSRNFGQTASRQFMLGLVLDNDGNIIVSGAYKAYAFQSKITSVGELDGFLAKIDPKGNILWAKSVGGVKDDYVSSVAVDANNNVYTTGFFTGEAWWSTSLKKTSKGNNDMFVAKYNSSGEVQWVNQINVIGITYEVGNTHFSKVEIVADKQGNCYTSFSYDTLLSCEKFADKPLVGDNDLFIVKYNTSGEAGWLYTNGSQNNSIYSGSLHVDVNGDLLVSGSFTGEIKILSALKANGAYDIFVAKFAPDATIKWAKSISGTKSEYCNYITTDAKNEIYLTGGFEGSIENNKAKITSTGEFDAFLTKLDHNGELISLYNIAEGPGKQSGTCIAVKDSIIAVAGNTLSQMSILSVPFPYYKDYDAFVVSLIEHNIVVTPPPPPPPPPPPYINPSIKLSAAFINAGQAIQINGQFFNPNGNVQISLEGPVSISVGNAFPASTLGTISFNLGTTSLRSGTYKCIATDLVSGKIATASFRVKTLPVSDNFLTILRPNNPIAGVINEAIQIEWSDYMFLDSKYKLIGPYREYSYKLEGQRNNGNWTTIKNITGNGLKNTNITVATQYVPVATGEFRFRITDNLSTARNKMTQIVTVVNSTANGATMEFLWDKSYKIYPATAPVGCAADGTSRMYIKISKKSSPAIKKIDITLTDDKGTTDIKTIGKVKYASTQNPNAYTLDGNYANANSAGSSSVNINGDYYFWYVAPDDFTRNAADADLSERIVTVKANITLQNNTTLNLSKNIIIVRPPLMLVHGLNGDHTTWDDFLTKDPTVPFIRDSRFKIVKAVDMEPTAAFKVNSGLLLSEDEKVAGNSFRSLIQSMHKLGYTCSRLDYVCHSMGGSMVRDAITRYPLSYYYKSNYTAGFCHKIITLGTPHNGSSYANLLQDIDNDGYSFVIQPVLESQNLFEKVNFNTYRIVPAVADLRFESGVHFKESEVKSHLIFGSLPCVGFNVTTIGLLVLIQNFYDALGDDYVCNTYDAYMTNHGYESHFMDASDGIVSRSSQMAGLNPSTSPQMVTPFANLYHTSTLGNAIYDDPTVGKRVDELLNTSMHDPKFGFIPATSVQKVQKASTRQNPVKILTDKVQILYPLAGASRNINDSLTIKIKAEIKDLSLLILQFQGKTITIPSPKDSLISLPWQVSADHIETQEIQLTGLYKTGSTTAFSTARTTITVKALGNIQEWTVTPTFMVMEKGSIRRPKYEAIFDQSVSLVGASSGITASIDDKTVVSYSSSTNEFTALKLGIATISLSYLGKSSTISIEVIEHKDPNKDTTGVTAVDEYGLLDDGITIYPNPITSSEFYVNLPVELLSPLHIQLFNLQGQLISELNSQKFRTGTKTLLTLPSEISDGIYFLQIHNSRGIVSKKIIVQKQLK